MAVLRKIRIGTDITLGITVMASGHAVEWNSQDIKHVYAFSDVQGQPVAEMSYEQRGSTLRCVFHAEDQNYVGAYRVIIEFNDGSAFSSTLDMPAFEIVRTSEEADIDTGEIVLDIDGSMRFYSLAEVISKLEGLHAEVKAAASAAREASGNANSAATKANDAAALANSNASKAEASNKVINDNERKRIAQETARESAEADRQRAELERQKGDESIAAKEAVRERNEEVRETNEQTREDNELERRNAESARNMAEAQRASRETKRISDETSRQAAENKRVAAETSRQEAETARVNVESERVTEFARLKKESEEATKAASAVSDVVAQHTKKITKIEQLLQEGYTFMGVATSDTNPGTPDQKVFYIANGKGTYANFGGINVDEDEVVLLVFDGTWKKLSSGIASYKTTKDKFTGMEAEVTDLGKKIDTVYAGGATIDTVWLTRANVFSRNANYKSFIIPVNPGDKVYLEKGANNIYLAILSDKTNFAEGGNASLCADYPSLIVSTTNKTWTIPSDAKYVWIGLTNYDDYSPAAFTINGVNYWGSLFEALVSIGKSTRNINDAISANTADISVLKDTTEHFSRLFIDLMSERVGIGYYSGLTGDTISQNPSESLSCYYLNKSHGVKALRMKTIVGDGGPKAYGFYTDADGMITRRILTTYSPDTEYLIDVEFQSGEELFYINYAPNSLYLFNDYSEEEWAENINETQTANYLEYGGVSATGRLASTDEREFYGFFKSIRSGRLIRSNAIMVKSEGGFIEGYALSEDYSLVRKQTSFDLLCPDMTGAKYFNFSVKKFTGLDSAHEKESGYISARDGLETSRTGAFRLKGYFPKGTGVFAFTNQKNIRLLVYLYDSNYNFLSYTFVETNSENYVYYSGGYGMSNVNGAYFRVAFTGYSAENLSQTQIDNTNVFTVNNRPELSSVKVLFLNGEEVCQPTIPEDDTIHCLYETHPHVGCRYSETFINAEYYTEKGYFNAYMLRLPPNYDPKGKPVRLIIWCPGTGGYSNWSQHDFLNNLAYIKYWLSEGYAVASFLGNTSKYNTNYSMWLPDMAIETSVLAHIQGYKYLSSRYNIAKDGCFVSAKSLGGLMAARLLFEKNIPVLAVAPLAPKLDAYMISTSMDDNYYDTQVYAEDYQWDEGWEQYYDGTNTNTEQKKAYLKSQIRKMLGTQPLLNGIVGKTPDELFELGWSSRGNKNKPLGQCSRFCNTPIRIWCSIADNTIGFDLSEQFIMSLQNGGSPAELRALPAPDEGDNAHQMVDRAPSAPKVASIVSASGETFTDVPLAYVEVIQYFREHDIEQE